jgi:hypothetical protein
VLAAVCVLAPEIEMKEYIVVIDYTTKKAFALVKTEHGKASVIAGDLKAEEAFVSGEPDVSVARNWEYWSLGYSSSHPDIGYYLQKLGAPIDTQGKLDKAVERRKKIQKAKQLSAGDLAEITAMRSKGHSQRIIAAQMGVSQSFIQRHKSHESPTL